MSFSGEQLEGLDKMLEGREGSVLGQLGLPPGLEQPGCPRQPVVLFPTLDSWPTVSGQEAKTWDRVAAAELGSWEACWCQGHPRAERVLGGNLGLTKDIEPWWGF